MPPSVVLTVSWVFARVDPERLVKLDPSRALPAPAAASVRDVSPAA